MGTRRGLWKWLRNERQVIFFIFLAYLSFFFLYLLAATSLGFAPPSIQYPGLMRSISPLRNAPSNKQVMETQQ